MLLHDSVVVLNRCVISLIRYTICFVTSLAIAFNCAVGSHFSSSSILALYSISTLSILSIIAFAHTITFCTFFTIGASGSSYISGSSEHNSTTYFLMLSSSFLHCTANAMTLQYLLSMLSLSRLSTTFSALTICSLSLNSSVIYAYKVLSVSQGSTTKSSCMASSCNPS